MCSALCDGAVFEDNDFVCAAHCADAVCNDQLGGVLQRIQRFLYLMFGFHIECGGGVVHD